MARVLVVDVNTPDVRETVCSDLDDFYRELECECFDIARRKVGEKYFDIFCDDMGLFREMPVVSAIDENDKPMLVGNLVLANHNSEGETTDLTDDDIELISRNIMVAVSIADGIKTIYPVLRCRY